MERRRFGAVGTRGGGACPTLMSRVECCRAAHATPPAGRAGNMSTAVVRAQRADRPGGATGRESHTEVSRGEACGERRTVVQEELLDLRLLLPGPHFVGTLSDTLGALEAGVAQAQIITLRPAHDTKS